MSRLRTHNNRRRARELKQGGLYTLQRHHTGPTWGESGASVDEIVEDMRRLMFGDVSVLPIVVGGRS